MTDPPLATWQHSHIAAFLAQYKCAHHADKFRENDITGAVILDLGQDELRELGVSKVGERVRLLSGIKELRRKVGVAAAAVVSPAVDLRRAPTTTTRYPLRAAPIEVQLNGQTTPIDGTAFSHHETSALARTSGSIKRLNGSRPPPLDLHQTSHASVSPQAIRRAADPKPTTASSLSHTPSIHTPTPRAPTDGSPFPSSSVPAPQRRLRAPAAISPPSTTSPGTTTRRSPSPIPRHTALQAREFIDRPLPARPDALPRPTITRAGSHGRMLSLGTTTTTTTTTHPYAAFARPSTSGAPYSPPSSGPARLLTAGNSPRRDRAVAAASPAQEYAQQQQQQQQSAVRPGKLIDRSQSAHVLSLDAVRRRCVKFILADDASTRVVDLERCANGVEVMDKVLKKFGKVGPGGVAPASGSEGEDEDEDEDGGAERALMVDGWAVFSASSDGESRPFMRP